MIMVVVALSTGMTTPIIKTNKVKDLKMMSPTPIVPPVFMDL